MKTMIALASILLTSGLANAASKALSADAVEAAQVVRSFGARSCFETLEKGGGELSFDKISVNKIDGAKAYIIEGSTIVGGDVVAGNWTVEVKKSSSSNPEEGSFTTCEITKNQE